MKTLSNKYLMTLTRKNLVEVIRDREKLIRKQRDREKELMAVLKKIMPQYVELKKREAEKGGKASKCTKELPEQKK